MPLRSLIFAWTGLLLASASAAESAQQPSPRPWTSRSISADQRAHLLVAAMTLDEKIALLHTKIGTPFQGHPKPDGALNSAGYGPGIARLGIPPLEETDAGLGLANPVSQPFDATALPCGLAIGASFDPALARSGGAMIAAEAKIHGFNVMLAGGANLIRDPRNGRNFEYVSEDPLLTGVVAGAMIAGVQSQGLISTVKHFAVNAQETGRVVLSSDIGEAAAREADLLAFEIAIERGAPFSVMTGYNRINSEFAAQNAFLINRVLKQDWHFKGWVMSDWGGTHSTEASALAGLDQESGDDLDPGPYFAGPLKAAVEAGRVPQARIDDMVFRILRAEIQAGIFDHPPSPGGTFDAAADAEVAEKIERQGIVLLKNDRAMLPLDPTLKRVLVIGEHADFGVLSGGGSSQVVPLGALRMEGDPPGRFFGKPKLYDPSSPLEAVKRELPDATVSFVDGHDIPAATRAARDADVVLIFAEQWMNESRDAPSLALPKNQEPLIAAVAAANPKTVVILETGGPVTMPWLSAVPAVLEAWYPGSRGGEAIAAILFGHADPSGRLPLTFPRGENQLPRSVIRDADSTTANPGEALKGAMFGIDYNIEGADVGYKWFARTHQPPLFPFGFGLSYTHFTTSAARVRRDRGRVTVQFRVTNTGSRDGIDTPQVYVESTKNLFTRRLAGWSRVSLEPGKSRTVSVSIDPRLLARFDVKRHGWHITRGIYVFSVRPDATGAGPETGIRLGDRNLPP
ncbi:MAG: beta-glucosidase [Beijerinckiaceae bacterium]|nr:beta-glucosidase [Beijerinckiaceae bacterium]